MELDELRRKREEISKKIDKDLKEMNAIIHESERVANVATNTDVILEEIDYQFEQATSLNGIDVSFLFFATMLQAIRWYFMPELKLFDIENQTLSVDKSQRLAPNEKNHKGGIYDGKKSGAMYEWEQIDNYKNSYKDKTSLSEKEFYKKENKYKTWIEIITQTVPYDAMNAYDNKIIPRIANLNKQNMNGTYNNIYAKNHHVASLGHDPILGWLFGTMNIMTNTITFCDFQSFEVMTGHKVKSLNEFSLSKELKFSDLAVNYAKPRSLISIFEECIFSSKEDYKRLVAAVVRQAIHMASDKYCKEGLPIPILSIIDSQKAQELIEKGWNSIEFNKLLFDDLKQVGTSAILSFIINVIIETIYIMCLETNDEEDIRKVKIKKILSISNSIASSSNVLFVSLTKNVNKLDIGGIGITLVTLLNSNEFIMQMKQEYIRNSYELLVMGDSLNEVCEVD